MPNELRDGWRLRFVARTLARLVWCAAGATAGLGLVLWLINPVWSKYWSGSPNYSRRCLMVIPEESAEPFATSDSLRTMPYSNRWKQQDVAFALMIALSVKVGNVFGQRSPQGALTEQNQLGQAFLFH